MGAIILRSELSILEGAMDALKPACEGRHGSPGIFRADQACRDKRGNGYDAIRTRKPRLLDSALNVMGPVHSGMLRTERIGKLEAIEVKSDQVAKRRSLFSAESVD